MRKRQRKKKKSPKRVILYSPGLKYLLSYEARQFATDDGKPLPPPLLRHLELLVSAVINPKEFLVRDEPNGNAWRIFAKTFARNPEQFLELMLHLTRYFSKLCRNPMVRAFRENSVITFRDRGYEIKKPINQASREELAYFLRTHYGLSRKAKTIARCKERLAKADSRLPASERLMRNALRIFVEMVHPRSETIPVPKEE